jgi:hypothetical protein
MEIAKIAPILKADKITLTISAKKTGNCVCDLPRMGRLQECAFRVSPSR